MSKFKVGDKVTIIENGPLHEITEVRTSVRYRIDKSKAISWEESELFELPHPITVEDAIDLLAEVQNRDFKEALKDLFHQIKDRGIA